MDCPINSVLTVRVNYQHEAFADAAFNVLHYQLKTATVISSGLPLATVPQIEDVGPGLAQKVAEDFSAAWSVFASEDVGVLGCTAQKVYPGDRSTPYNYLLPGPVTGQVVSQALPMQDCITILKKTGFGQRWGMGRLFVPGIPELNQDGGMIDDTAKSNINDNLVQVIPSELTFSVSGISYKVWPVVTNVPTPGFVRINRVTTAELSNTTIKTQRRRRPGKGS